MGGKCMGVLCSLGFGGLHEGSELTTYFRQVSSVPWVSVWRAQRQSPFGNHYEGRKCLGWRWALSGCPQMVWQMILVFFVSEVQTFK